MNIESLLFYYIFSHFYMACERRLGEKIDSCDAQQILFDLSSSLGSKQDWMERIGFPNYGKWNW